MENFESLMKQAVSIKTNQMLHKRQKFEAAPLFIKTGLYYIHKFENVRKQGFYQRFTVCDLLKLRGNQLFKLEYYEKAAREYEQALSIFRFILNKNPNWKNEGILDEDLEYINYEGETPDEKSLLKNMKISLYNNLAACYLKLEEYKNARSASEEALQLDPNQTKALFRRAKAITSDINSDIEEYKIALEDLKKAYLLAPEDTSIQQLLAKTKLEIQKMKMSAEKFKGIFNEKNEKAQPNNAQDTTSTKGEEKSTHNEKVEEKRENVDKKEDSNKVPDKKPIDTGGSKGEAAKSEKKEIPTSHVTSGNKERINQGSQGNIETKQKQGTSQPKSKTPDEVEELGKLLEIRGNEMIRLYQSAGRIKEAEELKEKLRKATEAKKQLEKISRLDFEKPDEHLKEMAVKFGLDLNDPLVKEELKRLQNENLKEIRNWINGVGAKPKLDSDSDDDVQSTVESNGSGRAKNTPENKNGSKTNKFDYEGLETSGRDSKSKLMETLKEHREKFAHGGDEELINDSSSKMNEPDSNSKVVKMMNLVIAAVAIILFLITLYLQMSHNNNKSLPSTSDLAKEM